jgi:acetyltransferase-like isoleucine patch superfamily enzyme
VLQRVNKVTESMPAGVTISKSTKMEGAWFEIEEGGTLMLGDGVKLLGARISVKAGARLTVGAMSELRGRIIVEQDSTLFIGDGLICNAEVHIQVSEGGAVHIGRDCLFANPKIYNSDMHAIFDVASGQRINRARNVVIGDRVWIASDALVLKGANVAADSVVGAGAVVGRDFPANVVLAGNPARVVREGIAWSRLIVERRPISFEFSVAAFRASAVAFDHTATIAMALPYMSQWRQMDPNNYFVFYYLARALLLEHFRAAPVYEIDIGGTTVTLPALLDVLLAAYECSERRNHVCGSYAYMMATMLGRGVDAQRLYDAIAPVFDDINEERFKALWIRPASGARLGDDRTRMHSSAEAT